VGKLMATIANNHLSESALGRFGDTEMYKTSPSGPGKGKEWHVNPEEKQLMNMYGAEGEKLVDSIGSGTINPYTGKEEKFLGMTWAAVSGAAAIGSALVGAYSAWKGGSNAKEQASAEEASARSGLEELDNAEANLEKSVQAKREAGMLDYRQDVENVSAQTGIAQEDLQDQTAQAIQKSGMATSGTVGQKSSQMWNRIQSSFERGREGLIGELGKKMGDIEGWYEGEKSRIASERNKLNNQIGFAEEKQKGFFG
jgi:hypothetical protein